jgi:hypothetical protein
MKVEEQLMLVESMDYLLNQLLADLNKHYNPIGAEIFILKQMGLVKLCSN